MVDKTFILTDKIEFIPDEDLEGELNFNLRTTGYVFNKTLEYSIYRENLVKEFGIGKTYKINRTYTQKIVRTLKKQKPFLKKAESTCIQASTDRLIKAYEGFYDGRTGRPKFKSLKKNPVKSITLRNNEYKTKTEIKGTNQTEPIIFMKHVKNTGTRKTRVDVHKEKTEFYKNVTPNTGENAYDDAYALRDSEL